MVMFTPPTKDGHSKSIPGKGKLIAPRSWGGCGEKYGPGGPGGSGGGSSSAGPTGTTKGPAPTTYVDFKGSGPSVWHKPWKAARGGSNPMKR